MNFPLFTILQLQFTFMKISPQKQSSSKTRIQFTLVTGNGTRVSYRGRFYSFSFPWPIILVWKQEKLLSIFVSNDFVWDIF